MALCVHTGVLFSSERCQEVAQWRFHRCAVTPQDRKFNTWVVARGAAALCGAARPKGRREGSPTFYDSSKCLWLKCTPLIQGNHQMAQR